MSTHYPLSYKLESGTSVSVNKASENVYQFLLTDPDGTTENFTYTDDGRTKEEAEAGLRFKELNALRLFWLKREDVI